MEIENNGFGRCSHIANVDSFPLKNLKCCLIPTGMIWSNTGMCNMD